MTNIWLIILGAVALVESSNGINRYNEKEQAFGIYQITPICVKDINNHTGLSLEPPMFYNNDELSEWAFFYYGSMYGCKTPEEYCRIWNEGPSQMWNDKATRYWKKVQQHARRILNERTTRSGSTR